MSCTAVTVFCCKSRNLRHSSINVRTWEENMISPLSALLHFLWVFVDGTWISSICFFLPCAATCSNSDNVSSHFFRDMFTQIFKKKRYSLTNPSNTPKKNVRCKNVYVWSAFTWLLLCILDNIYSFSSFKCVWYPVTVFSGGIKLPPQINSCIIWDNKSDYASMLEQRAIKRGW